MSALPKTPWSVVQTELHGEVFIKLLSADGSWLASALFVPSETEAIARTVATFGLFAAAPELLEALKRLEAVAGLIPATKVVDEFIYALMDAKAAIAKAEAAS